MNMVGSGFWDGIDNGVCGDDYFDNILNILDFPMESLEGDSLIGDWDAKFQCLGPIPAEGLACLPPVFQNNIDSGTSDVKPGVSVPSDGTSPPKILPNFVEETSSTSIPLQNDSSGGKESGVFQPPSPVSVLESSSSCSVEKSMSIRSEIVIPVRTRSKRLRSSTLNPWLVTPPIFSTSSMKRKQKKKRLSQLSGAMEMNEMAINKPLQLSGAMETKENSVQRPVPAKKCTHCQVTKTPQWREGPAGPKTLCNACGVRYRSGRLFPEYRPVASPTFVPSVHSNSHKKIIEMRNKAIQEATMAESNPAMSPPPEFIPMSSYLFD